MDKKALIDAAMGRCGCDLMLKGVNVVDVLGHTIKKCNIFIKDKYIVGCGDYVLDADKVVDCEGKFAAPAFIDAHVHIESSMLTPSQYAKIIIPKGVGTIIADPHEIANVCGEDGLDFMQSDKSELRVKYMLPSCVPATPFDSSGAVLDNGECRRLWDKGGFSGLGEMMNYPGVVGCDADVLGKLDICDKIDGHIPMVSGKELQAYICGGIDNDHECSSAEEALEKVSLGLNIYIREGTGAKNLEELIKAVTPFNMSHFAFCTDDKHIDDVINEGTISHCVSKAIKLGLDPVTAFTLGSYNAARFYDLKNIGAIAPGYIADIIIMDKLDPETISDVYLGGKKYTETNTAESDISKVVGTVHINKVKKEDMICEFSSETPIISAKSGSLITAPVYKDSPEGLMLCANIERHKASGRIGKAYVEGFTIKNGAVAQTIGHDAHNITVMGDNCSDMALAVNSLGKDGGIVVVNDGKVTATLTLEVAGLMSAKPYTEVLENYQKVTEAIKEISDNEAGSLLMILSFLSLPVIPEIKLTDKGLFDVNKFEFIK
jgi:adenine deaminase